MLSAFGNGCRRRSRSTWVRISTVASPVSGLSFCCGPAADDDKEHNFALGDVVIQRSGPVLRDS